MEKYELHSVTEGTKGAMDVIFSQVLHSPFLQPQKKTDRNNK
ncbi:hypothetical protein N9V04_01650 [Bacteroidota bacterium]|nr:hypothetical protein [Bacteroidota bacterium]